MSLLVGSSNCTGVIPIIVQPKRKVTTVSMLKVSSIHPSIRVLCQTSILSVTYKSISYT